MAGFGCGRAQQPRIRQDGRRFRARSPSSGESPMTRSTLTALALAAVLAGSTAVAVGPMVAEAQSQLQEQPAHRAAFDPGRHIEGRIAYLKTELKITDTQ